MAHNPYTPPTAPVNDRGPARAIEARPRQVSYAVWLFWLAIPLSVPATVYEYERMMAEDPNLLFLPFLVAMYVLAVALNVFIYRGHNWARLVLLLLFVVSVVTYFALLNEFLQYPFVPLASNLVVLVLDVVALYLLFTHPGKLWFRPPA